MTYQRETALQYLVDHPNIVLEWPEPREARTAEGMYTTGNVLLRSTVANIIMIQREVFYQSGKFPNINDVGLLDFFMVNHHAYVVDEI